jgi:hypothetical protein
MKTRVKVTIEDARRSIRSDKAYRVVALVNTLEPEIGSILTEEQANRLIDNGDIEVNVRAAKN